MNNNKPKNKRLTLTESEKQLISVIRQSSEIKADADVICNQFTSLIKKIPEFELRSFIVNLNIATIHEDRLEDFLSFVEDMFEDAFSFHFTHISIIEDHKKQSHEN